MRFLQVIVLFMVAVSATAVVLTKNPLRQCITLSYYGVLLTLLFLVFQAPAVALSQLVIGSLLVPILILSALAKIRRLQR